MSNLPKKVSYTEEQVVEDAKKKAYSEGWYRWLNVDVDRRVNEETGNMMITIIKKALENPQDAGSVFWLKQYHNFVLPLRNEEFPGHKPPKTGGLAAEYLRACFDDEIPSMPTWRDGQLYFKGQVIDPEREEATRKQVMNQVYEKCVELWNGGEPITKEPLINCAVYAELFVNGQYRNLKGFAAEKPDGIILVPKGSFLSA